VGEVLSLPRLSLIAAHNLYEDADGESHFRDIEVEWAQESPSGKISKRMPAAGLMVREITANFADTWHPAPRRQYVISLGGAVDITASDGETRHSSLRSPCAKRLICPFGRNRTIPGRGDIGYVISTNQEALATIFRLRLSILTSPMLPE
jgi:hypothetical protein